MYTAVLPTPEKYNAAPVVPTRPMGAALLAMLEGGLPAARVTPNPKRPKEVYWYLTGKDGKPKGGALGANTIQDLLKYGYVDYVKDNDSQIFVTEHGLKTLWRYRDQHFGVDAYGKDASDKEKERRNADKVKILQAWMERTGEESAEAPHLYIPRGKWADKSFLPRRGGKDIPPNEGAAAKPDFTVKLPAMPRVPGGAVRMRDWPFWRALAPEGHLISWLLKHSPIDEKSGVYFLYDKEGEKIYVGSSIGTSEQGNVRRTVNRHFQKWQRLSEWYRLSRYARGNTPPKPGGVVMPRSAVALCVMLVGEHSISDEDLRAWMKELDISLPGRALLHPARLVESWYLRAWSGEVDLLNQIGLQVQPDDPDVPF